MDPLAICALCSEPLYACDGHAPTSGVPRDLFPDGVPLHGELTPEQERWLRRR